jgi:hypothetical protein
MEIRIKFMEIRTTCKVIIIFLNLEQYLEGSKEEIVGILSNSKQAIYSKEGILSSNREGILSSNREGILSSNREGILSSNREGILSSNREGILSSNREDILSSNREDMNKKEVIKE